MDKPAGSYGDVLATTRSVCVFMLTLLTAYLIVLWLTLMTARKTQLNGNKSWLAMRIRSMPFGTLYFQEGLYFDCGICLKGFGSSEVIGLTCHENHVYHPRCLKEYLSIRGNSACILCGLEI